MNKNNKQVNFNTKDREGNTALMLAIKSGNNKLAKALLNYSNINSQNSCGATALILAAAAGNIEIVKELLKHPNIDVNLTAVPLDGHIEGDTALIASIDPGRNLEITKVLLRHSGMKLSLLHQAAVLYWAIAAGQTELAKDLLDPEFRKFFKEVL